jgi:hypothetical protein
MSYAIVDAATMAPAAGPHPAASPHDKGVGQALGVRTFGIYQIDLPAGGGTVGHDHRADGAEDVYALVAGTGWVVVDGQDVPVRPVSTSR